MNKTSLPHPHRHANAAVRAFSLPRWPLFPVAACALFLSACASIDLPPYNPDPLPPVAPSRPATTPTQPADNGVVIKPVPQPTPWPEPTPQQGSGSTSGVTPEESIITETAEPGDDLGEQPATPVQGNQCDATAAQFLIGQPYSISILNQVRESTRARGVRVLRPGDAATMDMNPQRANITLDANNLVAEVRCG